MANATPRTLIDKIIDAHALVQADGQVLLYLDRVIVSDTARPSYQLLQAAGHGIRRPAQVLYVADHYTPSSPTALEAIPDADIRRALAETDAFSRAEGVNRLPWGHPLRGIQHSVAVEQGFALPGLAVAATDSHTLTQGAVGALALSISADIVHALATQTVWITRPAAMRITLAGSAGSGVHAKDVALALLAQIGRGGAGGMAIEFAGDYVRSLSIAGRMTLCNLATELGARVAVVAPDAETLAVLEGTRFAPKGADWAVFADGIGDLASDPDTSWDREVTLDAATVAPMVSWGTSPSHVAPITGHVPDPTAETDPTRRAHLEQSLDYMGLKPGMSLEELAIDQVFIGSCANGSLEDLEAAGTILGGRRVKVPTLIVPGSNQVRQAAEASGLADTLRASGAVLGESGCSMCNAMNGDVVPPRHRAASTTNRNHIGRQGPGSRTHILSPAMAAAAAVTGRLTDVRKLGSLP